MGLGGFPEVSLADARKARDMAESASCGRAATLSRRERGAARGSRKADLWPALDASIEAKGPEWRNDKHKAQWKMTLEVYGSAVARARGG